MQATIQGSCINIPPVRLPGGGYSQPQSVSLDAYQGQTVRLYLSCDGAAEINPGRESYWLVAEAPIPMAVGVPVVVGTRDDVRFEPRTAVRSAGDEDAITLAENEHIDAAGFYWSRYVLGADYELVPGGLRWLTDRRPAADYPVEIAVTTTVDVVGHQVAPLDLSAHAVTLFDLPEPGALDI